MHKRYEAVSRYGSVITAAAMTFGVGLAAMAQADAATATAASYQGSAYGTKVTVGNLVKSGPSAPVVIGCGAKSGLHKVNTTADLNLAPIATTGTVRSTADTTSNPSRSRTTATTQQVNLLSGLVRASAVKSVSASTFANGSYSASGAGSSLLNLRIATVPITATPAPNTRVNIAGFGYVILNEQAKNVTASSARLSVNALHLYVDTPNPLGVKPGTQVIVSHALSAITAPKIAALGGKAYGSSLTAGHLVKSGPSFLKVMPCLGTHGLVRSNTGAGIHVGTVVNSGTIRNTVKGSVNRHSALEETTSRVETANVLSRLVQADVVKADANGSTDGTTRRFNDSGSAFVNLRIAGRPGIGDNAGANTKVQLAGLGTLYLHRVIRTQSSIEVRMIELVVTQSNKYGLAVGTDLRVAVAKASLR